jgi:hypothetical protein
VLVTWIRGKVFRCRGVFLGRFEKLGVICVASFRQLLTLECIGLRFLLPT